MKSKKSIKEKLEGYTRLSEEFKKDAYNPNVPLGDKFDTLIRLADTFETKARVLKWVIRE